MAKVGIVLGSNELSKVLFAGMWSVISTSMGDEVVIFATMDAVKAFVKENPEIKISDETSKKASNEDLMGFYRKAKKSGRLKVYACSYASKLFGIEKEQYNDVVDDIVGITSFQMEVEEGQIISVW
ncbi:DsrE family protein [Stygiolobus sp. CP850M]|jgi:peroxiredoxin family protein|uniref:DsrE family protein n=1 Tax=Stygiolobus sp. CP850M TaxID=3133134 RepID=UPI00307EEC3D